MKLNTNTTNLILLSIILFSSLSFIISEPTRHEVIFEGGFSSLKYKEIKLKLDDEVNFCLKLGQDIWKKMYDHDKILKYLMSSYIKDGDCQLYKAVKTGKFEIIFEKNKKYDQSPLLVSMIKETIRVLISRNYKKWDVIVSE